MTGWGDGLAQDAHPYEYELVRVDKRSGAKHGIGFTLGILSRLHICESEWKPITKGRSMADEEFDLQTMTRAAIIEWMREKGYDGPVSYTKKDLIEKVIPKWQNPEAPATDGESNVAPINKAKRARKAAAPKPDEGGAEGNADSTEATAAAE